MVKIILTLTLARGVPAAKANAATAAELVRWLWALGMMCREGAE